MKTPNGVAMRYLVDHCRSEVAHDPGWPFGKADGYGRLDIAGVPWKAHRYAWTLVHGPIPAGLHVLHRCDTPPCFWVDHLFLGTQSDNVADMVRKGRVRSGMRRTKSPPIQFRLLLDDYDVLERIADEAGQTPKDFVMSLTLERVQQERAT